MTLRIENQHDLNDIARLLEDERIRKAINEALIELARSERLHPVWPEDVMDQVLIVLDQAEKAHDEAMYVARGLAPSIERLRHRLRQTIAMAIRAYIHLESK